jgi:hypothetical protein
VETPEPFQVEPRDEPYYEPEESFVRPAGGFWSLGRRVTWVAALVLALSSFTGWYAGSSESGPTVSVIGWHVGVLGKLIFFVGPSIPESLVVIALGSLGTIFVLIRLIDIPDSIVAAGRGIGIWISLLAALAVIGGGLLTASEEL